MKRSFIKLFLLLLPCFAFAQLDSLMSKKDNDVGLYEEPLKLLRVIKITQQQLRIELNPPLNNVATTLSQNTLVQIKTYGTAALATLSIRGLGSQHCAMLWNGFNTQQSMHGTSDVSLVGLGSTTQNISLNYGASCAKDGGGSIAGSLDISAKPVFNNGLNLTIANTLGSFGYRQQMIYAGYKTRHGYLQIDYLNEQADNDFRYLKNGNPAEKYIRLKNGRTAINQFNVNGSHFFNKTHRLVGGINYTDAYRQIPVTEFQSMNTSFQKDKQLKSFLAYEVHKRRLTFYSGIAYFYDLLEYSDPSSLLYSASTIHKLIAKFKLDISFSKNHDLLFVLENNSALAIANQYTAEMSRQNFLSLNTAYTFRSKNDRFYANIQLRQQLNDTKLVPFVFDAVATYKALKVLTLQVKGGRVFRVPTLNDLYWVPGGNVNLLAEKGWSGEWMIKNDFNKNQFYLSNSFSNFYYLIDNWIVWLPTNQGYWTPQNIKKVFSRGLQEELVLAYKTEKISLNFMAAYQFNFSTQLSNFQVNDAANKKQLIYEPVHKATITLSFVYREFGLQYAHQFTGKRFTSTDNILFLPSFHTGNLLLSKTMRWQQFELALNVGVDNLYNSRYYMVESRPMPGRNYKLGLILKCNTQFNK